MKLLDTGVQEFSCDKSIVLHTFPQQHVFVEKHEEGTIIEMNNEELLLERFNERKHTFKAWCVSSIPGTITSFTQSWMLLVKIPLTLEGIDFPSLDDHFTIDMTTPVQFAESTFSLNYLASTRVPNPYAEIETVCYELQKCAAFRVDVPRSWQTEDSGRVEIDIMSRFRVASSVDDFLALQTPGKPQEVIIQRDTSCVTSDAELAALRHLINDKRLKDRLPSPKSVAAFKMIQDFHGAEKTYTNLHESFPQLRNPIDPFFRIPKQLLDRFRAFNDDHRKAYVGLTKIPNGLFFINGCPGSGKTEWNMVLAALIQCKRRQKPRRRHSPILFIVDINKTVDDAADRYFCLCRDAGLKLRIIRMHGWPYEMRHSEKLQLSGHHAEQATETAADFTKSFLLTASVARSMTNSYDPNKAPTLDEAAWAYFERHKEEACFSSLSKILNRMSAIEALGTEEWKGLRSSVGLLYRAVLAQADFIATTPVATYGSFSRLFRPEIIFIDEAPHARELTTLIPVAYFDPLAWIFTGDVNQTEPFVKGGNKWDIKKQGLQFNPYVNQLKLSTMARAAVVGALNSQLLVNKRAHGGLERLPSCLFYNGQMRSGYETTSSMWPRTTLHLQRYLTGLGRCSQLVNENRVIMYLREAQELSHRSSFWNPQHFQWVTRHVEELLKDSEFLGVGDTEKSGTIMIETPYRASMVYYGTWLAQLLEEQQSRVNVLTVDKAQGNQADVVFLDMVRTTTAGFMDDPKRLNVAITRARQAEIIVMNKAMTTRRFLDQPIKTNFTSKLWEDTECDGRVFEL